MTSTNKDTRSGGLAVRLPPWRLAAHRLVPFERGGVRRCFFPDHERVWRDEIVGESDPAHGPMAWASDGAKERQSVARVAQRARGLWSSGRVPFGCKATPATKQLDVKLEEADIVRELCRRSLLPIGQDPYLLRHVLLCGKCSGPMTTSAPGAVTIDSADEVPRDYRCRGSSR